MEVKLRPLNQSIVPSFFELGEKIRKCWGKYEYCEDALVEVASEQLQLAALHKKISAEDIIHLAVTSDPSISALQTDSPFGDLQLIPYRHARFFIEILYWTEGTTAIHDHGFSGAFSVLQGSTINAEYKFETTDRINHHFYLGNLSNPLITKLSSGLVQPIYSGHRFIHAAFHLENPTISVVIRTHQDDDAMPQFEYRGENLRIVRDFSVEFAKKIQGLRFLESYSTENFLNHFKRIFIDSPTDERYWLCRAFYLSLKKNNDAWHFLTERRSDPRVDQILNSIDYERLLLQVIKLRKKIEDEDIRYFIAILLNIPTWEGITQYLQKYHKDSENLIKRWLEKCKSFGFLLPKTEHTALTEQDCDKQTAQPDNLIEIKRENAVSELIAKRVQG